MFSLLSYYFLDSLDQLNCDFHHFFHFFLKNKKYTISNFIDLSHLQVHIFLNTLRIILSTGQSLRAIKLFFICFCEKFDSIEWINQRNET